MSYYHAKRHQQAKQYLDQREIEKALEARRESTERWTAWLERYRASGRARTSFDWRPRFQFDQTTLQQPPESEPTNAQEAEADQIIEGEFTEVEPETDFTAQDRTPF